jgi:N-acetylglucosamine-6-phosphate deacetylase
MDCKWIVNATIVAENGTIPNGSVKIEQGKVTDIREGTPLRADGCEYIEGGGMLLIPGMIDVHIHGARGWDMMDGTVDSILEVSKACGASGCTSFLPTSISSSFEDLLGMIRQVRRAVGSEPGARIAGIHIEGPYLNPKRKGMQNEAFLRNPAREEMKRILLEAGSLLKMVTLAPELPGGMELVSFLSERGIIVSLAHSDATYDEATEAFRLGASHITHCFNGMRPIHHRDPGLIVAAFEQPDVSLQAIADNVHLHPAVIRLMHRVKGSEKLVLITDALQAMGLGDGKYRFGGHEVTVSGGVATLQDGTLASSTVTMNEALKNTVNIGISLEDAVKMACRTPADLLGLSNKGRIAPGCDADLVMIDEQFKVIWTMIDGSII